MTYEYVCEWCKKTCNYYYINKGNLCDDCNISKHKKQDIAKTLITFCECRHREAAHHYEGCGNPNIGCCINCGCQQFKEDIK